MIKAIIISGFGFTIGNVIWDKFGINEPKLFYVPLAVFLLLMILYIKKSVSEREKITHFFLTSLVLLAAGNLIKQLFYTENIKQLNDYLFGGLIFLWLLINLTIKIRWGTKNNRT